MKKTNSRLTQCVSRITFDKIQRLNEMINTGVNSVALIQ
jgi:hypothetical protein